MMLPANYGQCGCQTVKKGPNYGASKVADIFTAIGCPTKCDAAN